MAACPTTGGEPTFVFTRVERGDTLPADEPRTVSVAVLDMHHGWPNLGHDAIVYAIQNIVCDLTPALRRAGMRVEVVSYDVRRGHRIPEAPGGRHAVYVGTGGPGHLDPARNDGVAPGAQGVREDPAWEAPLFRLFDAIREDAEASLLGVCHTFGVMCRWLGAADAKLRTAGQGGKSAGIVPNRLTDAARTHPWFRRLARELPDRRSLMVLDNRLYDLVAREPLPAGVIPLSYDANGPEGRVLTAFEAARDPGGEMPRILAVNHHPEIVNRPRQLTILRKRAERGAVSPEWLEERARTLTEQIADARGEQALQLTSSYLFLGPLRFHVYKEIRRRAERLGLAIDVDERRLPLTTFAATPDAGG